MFYWFDSHFGFKLPPLSLINLKICFYQIMIIVQFTKT